MTISQLATQYYAALEKRTRFNGPDYWSITGGHPLHDKLQTLMKRIHDDCKIMPDDTLYRMSVRCIGHWTGYDDESDHNDYVYEIEPDFENYRLWEWAQLCNNNWDYISDAISENEGKVELLETLFSQAQHRHYIDMALIVYEFLKNEIEQSDEGGDDNE